MRFIPVLVALCFLQMPAAAEPDSCVSEPVIDMHLHFHTEDSFWGPAPNMVTGEMGPDTVDKHHAQTLAEMKKNQVVLGVASAPIDWENVAPDRLIHSLEVFRPDSVDPQALEKAVKEGRIEMFGEMAGQYVGIPPDDRDWNLFYTLAEDQDLPVGIHTGGGPPGIVRRSSPKFRYEYGNPYLLQDILVEHPDLKVYMMHGGLAPWAREALAMMHMHPKLHMDIGAHVWVAPYMQRELDALLRKAVERGYTDRVLFGSDQMVWPSAISMAVDYIKGVDYLSEQQKRDILFENAVRFLQLGEKQREELIAAACP